MVPVTQGQILHDFTPVRSLEGSESRVADARGWGRGEQGFLLMGTFLFAMTKKFWRWMVVTTAQLS